MYTAQEMGDKGRTKRGWTSSGTKISDRNGAFKSFIQGKATKTKGTKDTRQ